MSTRDSLPGPLPEDVPVDDLEVAPEPIIPPSTPTTSSFGITRKPTVTRIQQTLGRVPIDYKPESPQELDPTVLADVYQRINQHWDELSKEEYLTPEVLLRNPELIFVDAEIAAYTGVDVWLGSTGVPMAAALLNEIDVVSTYEQTFGQTGALSEVGYLSSDAFKPVALFFDVYTEGFNRIQLDVVSSLLAPLSDAGKLNLIGIMDLWADGQGGVKSDEDRDEFLRFMTKQASEEGAFEVKRSGFEEGFDKWTGFTWVKEQAQNLMGAALGKVSNNFAANPNELTFRSGLTQGQMIAAAVGLTPQDEWMWNGVSGTFDILTYIVEDPLNVAFGVGGALKTSIKVLPDVKRGIEGVGRARRVYDVMKPFKGRNANIAGVKLPAGISHRVTWALFNKTVEEMVEQGAKNGTFQKIIDIAQAAGRNDSTGSTVGKIVDAFPRLAPYAEGFVREIVLPAGKVDATVDDVAQYFHDSFTGKWFNKDDTSFFDKIKDAQTHAKQVVNSAVRKHASDGKATVGDVRSFRAGIGLDKGLYENVGGVLRQVEETGSGKSLVAFSSDAKIGTIDSKIQGQLQRAVKALPKAQQQKVLNGLPTTKAGRKVLDDYMKVKKLDGLRFGEEGNVVLYLGAKADSKSVNLLDAGRVPDKYRPGQMVSVESDFAGNNHGILSELRNADARAGAAADGKNSSIYVINEMPSMLNRNGWDDIKAGLGDVAAKAWAKTSAADAKGNWAITARKLTALFVKSSSPHFDLTDGHIGGEQLAGWMRSIGARSSSIESAVLEFKLAPQAERWRTIQKLIMDASDEVDNPLIRLRLQEFLGETSGSFAAIDGVEMAMSASRSTQLNAGAVARGIIPSHYSNTFPAPSEIFNKTVHRYRSAKMRQKIASTSEVAGWAPKTKARRKALFDEYSRRIEAAVKSGVLDQNTADLYSKDDIMAMAYATVGVSKSWIPRGVERRGTGWMESAGRFVARPFNLAHSNFAKTVLTLNPFRWSTRVALLEEQARAALSDLPSFFRNPRRMLNAIRDDKLSRHKVAWQQATYAWVETGVKELLDEATGFDDALSRVLREAPGFSKHLDSLPTKPSTSSELRSVYTDFLERHVSEKYSVNDFTTFGKRLKKQLTDSNKAYNDIEVRWEKTGQPPDWNPEDLNELYGRTMMASFADEIRSSSTTQTWSLGGMNRNRITDYGYTYGSEVQTLVNDAAVHRFVLPRMRAAAAGVPVKTGSSAEAFTRTPAWSTLRTNARDVANHRLASGQGDEALEAALSGGDVSLASWWLDEIIEPVVHDRVSRLWQTEGDSVRILDGLIRGKKVTVRQAGEEFPINFGTTHRTQAIRETQKLVTAGYDTGMEFPGSVSAMFDPRFLQGTDNVDNPLDGVKRISNWILQKFGGEISETLNRRPAYFDQYRRHFDTAIGLGQPVEVARRVAHEKAVQMVNFVYFNTADATPMTKKLGQIIPFFSAFTEVFRTWFYRIPLMEAGPISGAAMMVRRLDRVYDAFENLGLLEVGFDINPETAEKTRSMVLRGLENPEQSNPFGRAASRFMFHSAMSLPRLFGQMTGVSSFFGDDAGDKDEIAFAVGTPIDVGSEGIMGVNDPYLSFSPVSNAVLTKLLPILGVTVGIQLGSADGDDDTIGAMAAREGVDPYELLRANKTMLTSQHSDETIDKIFDRTLDVESLSIKAGSKLSVPNSSMVDGFIKSRFFQFGTVDTPFGAAMEYFPGWTLQFARGLGLHAGADASNWWNNDENGEAIMPSGLGWTTPTHADKAAFEAEVKLAIHTLEALPAEEGGRLITRYNEQIAETSALFREITGLPLGDIIPDDYESVISLKGDTEQQLAWSRSFEKLEFAESELIVKANHMAGNSQLTKSFLGLISPGSPRLLMNEQRRVTEYYRVKNAVEKYGFTAAVGEELLKDYETADDVPDSNPFVAWIRKEFGAKAAVSSKQLLADYDSVQDVEDTNILIGKFMEDDFGTVAKNWMNDTYPGVAAFTNGKTFWGPGGPPPETDGPNAYFDLVDTGELKQYSPDVDLFRTLRAGVDWDKGVAMVREFGNEPVIAALGMLENPLRAAEIAQAAQIAKADLDWTDDTINGGAYINHRDRNATDSINVNSLYQQKLSDLITIVEQADALIPDEFTSAADQKTLSQALMSQAANFRDLREELKEMQDLPEWRSNPAEEIRSLWFEQHYLPYTEDVGRIFDTIAETFDKQEINALYSEYNQLQLTDGSAPWIYAGVAFPSPLDYQWSRKTIEEREQFMWDQMSKKLEWISLPNAQHIADAYPSMVEYLPQTEADMDVWNWRAGITDEIKLMRTPDLDGIRPWSKRQENNAIENADRILRSELASENRLKELEYLDMFPIERLGVAGALEDAPWMGKYVNQVFWAREQLERDGAGPESIEGRQTIAPIFNAIYDEIHADPDKWKQVHDIADVMFDKTDPYEMIMGLFFGKNFYG